MSEMAGSGSSEFSGAAGNTSGFSKPTKTSVFNQTTQPNTRLFGSTAVAPVFCQSGQISTVHPNLKGSKAGRTSSLFGTPTATSASTGGNTRDGFFASGNSNTSFGQSKPVGTTFAQLLSNKSGAPQTSTAGTGTGIFAASTSDSNAGETSSVLGTPTSISTSTGGSFDQLNATTGGNTGSGFFASSNSNTPFGQSKPVGTPLAQPSSNIFDSAQISAEDTGIFISNTTGSGSDEFSGAVRNTSGFGQLQFYNPAPLAALSPTKTSVFNQTIQPNTRLFGSTAAAPVFGQSGQIPAVHSTFEGSKAGGTSSLFGTPTATSASTGGNTRDGFFASSNSKISFGQSKPVGIPLVWPSSTIFGTPQTSTGTGIFGASTSDRTCSPSGTPTATLTSTEELFSLQNTSMGGNRDGVLFSSIYSNTSFQQSKPVGIPLARPSSTIFDAPQTSTADAGMFGASTTDTYAATSGFGATSTGGTNIKFIPVTGTDTFISNGVMHTINTSHQSITVMKEYETKDFEELRFEYYFANRKVEQLGTVGDGIFEYPKSFFNSTTTISTSLFGANDSKLLFGTTLTTSVLGDVMMKIQLFAAPQPNIFGTTAPSTFGTQTTRFDQTVFRQPNQNNLFYQDKPAFGFGSTQATGFGFGTNTSTNEHGLFGSKPSNSGFKMTLSAFGTNNTFEATSTAQPATGESKNTAEPGGKRRKKTWNE